MNRLTAILTAAALAAAGLFAAEATTAAPRIDPEKVEPQPLKPAPQIKPGVLKVSDCATHFKKQPVGGESYNCTFNFKPVCRNGTVLGPVTLKKVGDYWRVTYACYEPPH